MTALLVTAIIVIGLAGYFTIGVLARRYTMPRALERAHKHYQAKWGDMEIFAEKDIRRQAVDSVQIDGISGLTLWLWPVLVPYYAFSGHGRPIDSYAPWAAEERAAKAEKRIAELERELGIASDGGGDV